MILCRDRSFVLLNVSPGIGLPIGAGLLIMLHISWSSIIYRGRSFICVTEYISWTLIICKGRALTHVTERTSCGWIISKSTASNLVTGYID